MGCDGYPMIQDTDFNTIYEIWYKHLWPNRLSKIESHSAMLLNETYDIKNFDYKPIYLIYRIGTEIAGCNSGHMCSDNTYRSRGLYVFPAYRKQGIAVKLLKHTINKGMQEKANLIWSYPRFESWSTYMSAGFELQSMWKKSETGLNAYCTLKV